MTVRESDVRHGVWEVAISFVLLANLGLSAQTLKSNAQDAVPTAPPSSVDRAASGDSPDDPGPLAADLLPAITHADVRKAAKKVADWQLAHSEQVFNQQWTFAALYDGLLA